MFITAIALLSLLQQPATEDLYTTKYGQCITATRGVTSEIHNCIADEIEVQDKKLNDNYKKLLKEQSPAQKKQLIAAQRLWVQYMKANCQYYADPQGGTAAGIAANECYLRETAERANELTWLFQP